MTLLALVFASAVGGCGGSVPVPPDPASLAIGGLTLGAFLDDLQNKVQATISAASAEMSGLMVKAGGEMTIALDQARVAYETELGNTVKITQTALVQTTGNLQVSLNYLEKQTANDIKEAGKGAQQMLLTLPFANGAPQVKDWSPKYVAPGEDVQFHVSGIFTQAGQVGYTPSLTIGSTEISAHAGTAATQDLAFLIPAALFPNASAGSVTPVVTTLKVPYHNSNSKKDVGNVFTLLLGVLPVSAGTVYLHHQTHSTSPQRSFHRTATTVVGDGSDKDQTVLICTDPPLAGRTLVQPANTDDIFKFESVKNYLPTKDWQVGWSKQYSGDGAPQRVCFKVWARGFSNSWTGGHHSASVQFHLEWFEEEMIDNANWVDDTPVTLPWGQAQSFDISKAGPGGWLLYYKPFDGPEQQIGTPTASHWVTVTTDAAHAYVQVVDPRDISY